MDQLTGFYKNKCEILENRLNHLLENNRKLLSLLEGFGEILPGFVYPDDPFYHSNPTTNPDIYGPPAVPELPGGKFTEGQVYYNPATGYTYKFVNGGWIIISRPEKPSEPKTPDNVPKPEPGKTTGTGSGSGTGSGTGTGSGSKGGSSQGSGERDGRGTGQGKGGGVIGVKPSRSQWIPPKK